MEALIEFRDTAAHFSHRGPALAERLLEVGLACVTNFASAANDWFGRDLSQFKTYIMPLTLNPVPQATALQLRRDERAFAEYLESLRPDNEAPASSYAFALNVEVRFVRSKAAEAFPVQVTRDPSEPAVRLTEDQMRERSPWDYKELTRKCRARYKSFKADQNYHQIRMKLVPNPRFAYERLLEPKNPRSSKKVFYSPGIREELDKHYEKK